MQVLLDNKAQPNVQEDNSLGVSVQHLPLLHLRPIGYNKQKSHPSGNYRMDPTPLRSIEGLVTRALSGQPQQPEHTGFITQEEPYDEEIGE